MSLLKRLVPNHDEICLVERRMMDLIAGEMRQPSSKTIREIIFKQLKVRQANPDEDFQGADIFLNSLAVAHRNRATVSRHDYNGRVITIRRRDFSDSEYEKLSKGICLAKVWLFEFKDAWVLCLTTDLQRLLRSGAIEYQHNKNEPNGFYSIALPEIPHLLIELS